MHFLEGVMSSSVTLINGSNDSVSTALTPVRNRITGTRNSDTEDREVPTQQFNGVQPAQGPPSDDTREGIPDVAVSHDKAPEPAKPISVPVFPSRIEIRILSNMQREHQPSPLLDIRV